MKINLQAGKYIIAVSGGVDSVSLLHALSQNADYDLVVAHFDHGIRCDSKKDRQFVERLASEYGLKFVCAEGRLGANASEATARRARYAFLREVLQNEGADAIITAHHRDDVIETAIINLLRGTGRKGLSSLQDCLDIKRPLTAVSKTEITEYAKTNNLMWREDPSNKNEDYLRNYVRNKILSKFNNESIEQFFSIIEKSRINNKSLDTLLVKYLDVTEEKLHIERARVINLPYDISQEAIAQWLRSQGLRDFDNKTINRLTTAAKTASPGSRFDIMKNRIMKVEADYLALE